MNVAHFELAKNALILQQKRVAVQIQLLQISVSYKASEAVQWKLNSSSILTESFKNRFHQCP